MVHDRRGRELETLAETGLFGRPRFSPDGQRIVAEKFQNQSLPNATKKCFVLGNRSTKAVLL
jgi:hypothetical protein